MTLSAYGPLSRFGLMIATAALVADQATKFIVLKTAHAGGLIRITSFFDIAVVLNRGVSYGLFPQDGDAGRWMLTAVKLFAALLFILWLARVRSRLVAASLGLLVGGALGNAIDRTVYGAVVDFVSLHVAGWNWYVFNLADTAVVAGVVGLLYDAVFGSATKSPPSGST
jgi:signal peptidase II